MIQLYPYLTDSSFLLNFTKTKITDLFIKITILTMAEKPIKEIQGKVLNGNLNIDGNSAVRRTGNLSIFIEETDASYMEIGGLFSLNKKIKIEIGLKNTSGHYNEYPILWFPQGIYAIINLSSSHSVSGTTINLQIKDKMVYLNGECGGTISNNIILDEYDVLDPATGEYVIEKPTIVQIIQELVSHLGGESLNKIIISDIENRVKKVMKWTKNDYLYFYTENNSNVFTLTPFRKKDSKILQEKEKEKNKNKIEFDKLDSEGYAEADWNAIVKEYNEKQSSIDKDIDKEIAAIKNSGNWSEDRENETDYFLKIYSTGDDIGYIYSDFYFPKELVANAGESICTILDTIKNTLGNFEYFYDLDGNFVFQEIKNYLNTSQATNVLNNEGSNYLIDRTKGKAVYDFSNEIITSFSSSPQYNNIKNDFMVWGLRETVEGKTIPIRYHLAIDSKPKVGNVYNFHFYDDPEAINLEDLNPIKKAKLAIIIDKEDSFPEPGEIGRVYVDINNLTQGYYWNKEKYIIKKVECKNMDMFPLYPTESEKKLFYTITGSDKFYKWNPDYDEKNPSAKPQYIETNEYQEDRRPLHQVEVPALSVIPLEELTINENIFLNEELATDIKKDVDGDGKEDTKLEYRTYYHPAEFKTRTTEDWREELYFSGVETTRFGNNSNYYYTELENEWTKLYDYEIENPTWKDNVINNPSELDFFLDFIESDAKISEFSISNIGRRTHVINDDSINCIFEPEIPNFILIEANGNIKDFTDECDAKGQPWLSISSDIWAGLAQGGSHNSAFNMIQDLLYQYTGYNEAITLEVLPMYFLEPNIRITTRDKETGIYGDYMLNSFSISLDVNGTMSLSCTRVLERI